MLRNAEIGASARSSRVGGRRRRHPLGIFAALAIVLGAVAPITLATGIGTAAAAQCSNTQPNCAPTDVQFFQPGTYNLGGLRVCGIESSYAPMASFNVDAYHDDPENLHGTNEGNYVNSESFRFDPAQNTSLQSGDTVTIGLPHPVEPYNGGGSVLPGASASDGLTLEQQNSTIQTFYDGNSPDTYFVEVTLAGIGAGEHVELNAFNPYNPPNIGNGPGPNISNQTGTQFQQWNGSAFVNGNASNTDGSGTAYFLVQDGSNQETVTLGATDYTDSPAQGILQTATVDFNGGTPGSTVSSSPCNGFTANAPSFSSSSGGTYLLVVNGTGYILPSVTVTQASGSEVATFTVPVGVPPVQAGQQATLVVLDATSPPGQGTPSNPLASPNTPYPPSAFSVQTSEDAVPGYPQTAPVFQADASNNIPDYPVEGFYSTLTTSAPSATVGSSSPLTATATYRDFWNNPVNKKQAVIFQSSSTGHASVTPQTPPTSGQYPETGSDGTVTYAVSDTCAETVNLRSTDVDDHVNAQDPLNQQVTFTAAASVPPDGTTVPTTCGTPTVHSSVAVSYNSVTTPQGTPAPVPADGTSTALVTVTLGDQFGNADSCDQVVLSPAAKSMHAQITPLAPTNPCGSSTSGPGYSDVNGVAKFLVSDATAEQVVLGVSDTTVISVWPGTSANPQDVAEIHFEGADAGQSTVVASSGTAPADGQPAATVTVTLQDAAGQALQGKHVTLAACTNNPAPTCTTDPTTTITAASSTTDANGQEVFNIANSATALPHTSYFQATDTTDSVVVTATASIQFTQGGASLAASPATVVADGIGTTTLTFTAQDTHGNPIPGANVSVAASPSSGATVSGAQPTNFSGQASFTASDTAAGPVQFTATAVYPAPDAAHCIGLFNFGVCTATAVVNVRFVAQPQTFTVNASPSTGIPADGIASSTVTVTALDSHGNPIAGLPVTLTDVGNSGVIGPNVFVTSANGIATFSVSDTVAETVTLTAGYYEVNQSSGTVQRATGCGVSGCQATATFVPTESQASTVTANPGSVPADGHTPITVTVTLLSGTLTPLSGHSVTLTTGSSTTVVTPGTVGGRTNGSGVVTFTVTDSVPENLNVYATDLTTGAIINQMPAVSFVATELQLSTVVAVPTSLPASGPPGNPDTSVVTVTVIGPNCLNSLSGHTISLSTPSGTAHLSGAAVTNGSGAATFTLTDTAIETDHLTATDQSCGVVFQHTADVTFTAGEQNQSTVIVSASSTPAQGPGATLTVTLLGPTDAPLSGRTVTVPSVGGATVTPLSYPGYGPGVTNAAGQAQFTLTDNTVEVLTFAAYDGASELDQTATVSFTANEANQSTLGANPPSLPAGGPTTTVTVTLTTGGGLPITGDVVSLSATTQTVSISPAQATTNALGQATFTVGDSAVETAVLTALDRTTGVGIYQKLSIGFFANEQNQSTATVTPTILPVKKTATLTVTLRGPTDLPLVGHTVTLGTGSSSTKVTVLTSGGKTNSSGVIQFSVTDTLPQTLTITVTDTTTGVTLYKTVALSFTKA
jgi:adhesin/invasin